MKLEIFDMDQSSPDWFKVRCGIVTASCFSDVLSKGQGKTRKTYMLKLLGERITGQPTESFNNRHTERGIEMEPEARHLYEFMTDNQCERVGFMRRGNVGCSPDSLIGNDGLLEIKTKLPHLQCEVLLNDEVPAEHKAQVQGQLWVSEREWVDFVSYWPNMPLFVKRVYRDEKYIETLQNEIERFLDELNELETLLKQKGAA